MAFYASFISHPFAQPCFGPGFGCIHLLSSRERRREGQMSETGMISDSTTQIGPGGPLIREESMRAFSVVSVSTGQEWARVGHLLQSMLKFPSKQSVDLISDGFPATQFVTEQFQGNSEFMMSTLRASVVGYPECPLSRLLCTRRPLLGEKSPE